jgi:hypothetical protein
MAPGADLEELIVLRVDSGAVFVAYRERRADGQLGGCTVPVWLHEHYPALIARIEAVLARRDAPLVSLPKLIPSPRPIRTRLVRLPIPCSARPRARSRERRVVRTRVRRRARSPGRPSSDDHPHDALATAGAAA